MLNWFKNLYSMLKNFKFSVGDMGLNIKPEINTDIKSEIKVADNQTNKLFEVNQNDNSQKILQQFFAVTVLPNINVNDAIRIALSAGNENAKLIGDDVQKLLENNKISEEEIQRQLSNPEIISTIAKANEIAYKTSDTDKRKMLSDLIYKKIKEDANTDESNILSLAIQEMDILTINHIKALSFLYIIKSQFLKNYTTKELNDFQNKVLSLILNFKDSNVKTIGNFLASTRTLSGAHIGWGIASYLPQILLSTDKSSEIIADEFKPLSIMWNDLSFTGAYITPIGKYIAQTYLFNNFGLLIEDSEEKNSTKDLSDDVSATELKETLKETNTWKKI